MKTRAKKQPSKSTNASKDANTESSSKTLPPPVSNPPYVFVLPKDISPNARILTLPSPVTSTPSRYLVDPQKQSCYEFTRIAAPKRACRSWLLASNYSTHTDGWPDRREDDPRREGYVLEKPDLMTATPMDPLFLILPALAADGFGNGAGKLMYLSASDYLDRLEEKSVHFKDFVSDMNTLQNLQRMFEARIRHSCDVMDIGDGEMLYRLSMSKLLNVLCKKATKVVERSAFPASMEERFVKQTLAVPLFSVRREQSSIRIADESQATEGAQSEVSASESASQQDSQSSTGTTASISTTATSVLSQTQAEHLEDAKEESELQHLLRLRTALNYILKSYIPPMLQSELHRLLLDPMSSPIDFTVLDSHLSRLDKLRKEAQTLRSLSDNISRKRSAVDEDDAEALEKAEAKKRKKEEEEIRKKNVSRGVKALEKVDRSGMKTLSSFFSAKPGVKKG